MEEPISIDYRRITPAEAIELQNQLRNRIILTDDFGPISTVAGVDVCIGRGWKEGKCGIVVLSFPELQIVETKTHTAPIDFPYVPGLLAFREVPVFLETYELLKVKPDLIFFDGHGYAHPRRFGLACHAGLIVNKPTIGCAKSRLTGTFVEPAADAGSVTELIADDGEVIGSVVRTKKGTKPVFISPGHRISLATATKLALECTRSHRIPEPTRLAHELVSGKSGSNCPK
jgi:deoxyribonuclease V